MLRRAEIRQVSGVYRLRFKSGDTYVGSAIDLHTRKKQLLTWAEKPSKRLKKAFDDYGTPKFEILVVTRSEDRTYYEYLILQEFKPSLNKMRRMSKGLLTQHIAEDKKAAHSRGCRDAQNRPQVKENTRQRAKKRAENPTVRESLRRGASEFMEEGKWRAVATQKANQKPTTSSAARSRRTAATWAGAEERRRDMQGDKNPSKRPEVKRKISEGMKGIFHWTVQHKAAHYHGA